MITYNIDNVSGDTEISADTIWKIGDRIRLTFRTLGVNVYTMAIQLYMIELKVAREFPNLEVLSTQQTDDGFIMVCQVKPVESTDGQVQQASALTAGIVAAAIIAGGVFTVWSLTKVERIVDSPSGQIALAGAGVTGIALFIVVVLMLLSKVKK